MPEQFNVKHLGKQAKSWIIDNYWKAIFASSLAPQRAIAMDSDLDELVKAMNDYEWENPIMPGDMMMQALGFLIILFFGRVFSDVLETEKNFAEIIDIINESMIITGTDDENLNLNYKDIDGNLENMNISSMNMGFNVKQNGEKQQFHWKKDELGVYVIPERLIKYTGSKRLEVVRVTSRDNPAGNDIIFQSEYGGDNQFEELFVKVRACKGSEDFIKIPAYTFTERK